MHRRARTRELAIVVHPFCSLGTSTGTDTGNVFPLHLSPPLAFGKVLKPVIPLSLRLSHINSRAAALIWCCLIPCRAREPGTWMEDHAAADLYRQHRGSLISAFLHKPRIQELMHVSCCSASQRAMDPCPLKDRPSKDCIFGVFQTY